MEEYVKSALPIAAVLGALILLFTLLNGIPWASRSEMALALSKIDKNDTIVSLHSVQLTALGVQREEMSARLDRIERKVDTILAKMPQYPRKEDFGL